MDKTELKKVFLKIKTEMDAKIDNVINCPKKPSDYKAYQLGFNHCFVQIENIIEKIYEDIETENGRLCAHCGAPKDNPAGLTRDGLTGRVIRCPFHD